jgi:phosphotransferase system HPr (HPr) family protein
MPAKAVTNKRTMPKGGIIMNTTMDLSTTRLSRTIQIEDFHGLHARPAALFVKAVTPFQVEIVVRRGEDSASGKSILSLMILGARPGDVLTVIAEGPDAAAAMQALDHLFQRQPNYAKSFLPAR